MEDLGLGSARTTEPFVSVCMVGVGPAVESTINQLTAETGPAAVDFGVHTSGITDTHVLSRQPLGKNTQWFISWQEHSGSAHNTWQLGAGSGVDRFCERSAPEAAQIPGSSISTSAPAASTLAPNTSPFHTIA